MKLKKSFSIFLFCFLLSLSTKAQLNEKLDQIFKVFVENEKYSGNVLITDLEGNTIYEKSVGFADERFEVPNSRKTRFDIASVSKQFTAALILKLYEEGKIDLQAPITTYLTDYRNDTGEKVKVIDLLTHQSGIPNYTSLPGVWTDSLRNHYSFKELISKFCSGDLEFSPGTKYKYNNSGYAILAAIIENVSNKNFDKIMQEKILEPLQLDNTGLSSREVIIPKKAYGYVSNGGKKHQANYTYMTNLNGAGSMYSTTDDLVKWSLILHKNNGKALSQKSYQLMTKAYATDKKWIAPYKNGYGFGLGMFNNSANVNSKEFWDTYFHSGHISGFSSYLITFKNDGYVVALLSNTGNISTIEMNNLSVAMVNLIKKTNTVSSGK